MSEVESEPVRRLPPGPHGLSQELVERNQRERLIAAMAEVSAAKGYGSTSVADLARAAGVSTASFYRQFEDKRDCMLASFAELLERLWGEIERACARETEPQARVGAGIRTAVALLAGDPPTARLLAVEIAAVGVEGVRLQQEAIDRLASRLRAAGRGDGADAPAPPSAEWTAAAAMVALVTRRVAASQSPDAAELEALWALL